MSFPRYPAYKDSGVEWLGEVPAHWEILALKRISPRQTVGIVVNPSEYVVEEGLPFIYGGDISEGQIDHISSRKISPEDSRRNEKTRLQSGDLLTVRVGAPGVTAVVPPECDGGNCASVMLIRRGEFNSDWLCFVMNSRVVRYQVEVVQYGAAQEQFNINHAVDFVVPTPARMEQDAIAAFLNHETAKIDALVAEQERLIELLKEKRQAVISHAVTKGLDPSVPMKDSGVEWLGEVPAHWDVTTIKRIVSTPVTDGPHETPVFLDEGIPFVSAEAVSSGRIDFERIRGFISLDDHRRFSQKYIPQRDDIFMIKSGATTGVSAIVETDQEFNIWSPLAVIRCGPDVLPRFALHFIRSRNFLEGVTLGWSFGTQQNIGMGVIENLSIVVPPLAIQREIVDLLDKYVAQADELISEAQQAITILQERRTALISVAVTGHIDVRLHASIISKQGGV